jgi:LysR family transcriptional regulator AphB
VNSIFGSLDDLYLFCQVVDAGSLQQASQRLSVAESTVSRRLSLLEQRLGIRLLERKGRTLTPTESGNQLFDYLRNDLQHANEVVEQLLSTEQQVQGNLRLLVPFTLYQTKVGAVVEAFMAKYPKVTIDVKLSLEETYPESDRELVINFHPIRRTDLIARPYFVSQEQVFSSPAYLAKHGTPAQIADLEGLSWVGTQHRLDLAFHNKIDDEKGEETLMSIKPKMVINDVKMVERAIESGLGVAVLPVHLVDTKTSTLIPLLTQFKMKPKQAYILYRRREYQPKVLSLFVESLLGGE